MTAVDSSTHFFCITIQLLIHQHRNKKWLKKSKRDEHLVYVFAPQKSDASSNQHTEF